MLITIVGIYTLYVLVNLYTSVMQIGYVNQAKKTKAVLLSETEFIKAANYSVAKEKMSILSTFIDYIVFIFWIGNGIKLLQDNIYFENDAVLNIAIVFSLLIIGSIISLPFNN